MALWAESQARALPWRCSEGVVGMIRKSNSGEYRPGTFGTRAEAEQHERAVQYSKRRGQL